jgi:hypothetical protein
MSFLNNLVSLFGGGSAANPAPATPATTVSSPFLPILERGSFFYPAGLHYRNPAATVICDRCRRSGIKSCVGYESQDLCLPCVEQIISSICALPSKSAYSFPLTLMEQGIVQTKMEQAMLQPKKEQVAIQSAMNQDMLRTFMMQSDFSRITRN